MAGRDDAGAGPDPSASEGFSLVELLIAVAIFGLLVARRGPFVPQLDSGSGARQPRSFPRRDAESGPQRGDQDRIPGQPVQVARPAAVRDDGSGWELGWILYVDENQDGEISAGETVIRIDGSRATASPCAATARSPTMCPTPASATPGCFPARCRWARSSSASPARTRCRWCWPTAAAPGFSRPGDPVRSRRRSRPSRVVDDILQGGCTRITVCSVGNTSHRAALPVSGRRHTIRCTELGGLQWKKPQSGRERACSSSARADSR